MAVVFGVLASLCFAVGSLLAQRGFHSAEAPWGAWLTLVANTAFLALCHFVLYGETRLFVVENLTFVAIGLFVPGITRVLTFRGIRTVGSTVTSTIVNTTPLFSTLLAIFFLAERPDRLILLGGVSIVVGLVVVSWNGKQRPCGRLELVFPLMAALLFAVKDVAVRWGLGSGGQPVLAAAIAAFTSTLAVFALTRWFQRQRFSLPPPLTAVWFIASGLFTGGSFLFMYLAFSLEPVAVVAPLINSYAVFVLLLTPLVARNIEVITWRKALGALLVVAGIFLISFGR
ncbi:MAG TPA: DMT family transporter [Candidatus Eisenbacteria bacterium]|nr:DMT family transporter [Candidatus Eisenbacteria bacterium]